MVSKVDYLWNALKCFWRPTKIMLLSNNSKTTNYHLALPKAERKFLFHLFQFHYLKPSPATPASVTLDRLLYYYLAYCRLRLSWLGSLWEILPIRW